MAIQQAPQQQVAQQQQPWQPSYTKEQTRSFLSAYKENPKNYNVDILRNHASHYNIPFYEGEFGILDAVSQAAGGFFEGFTTLRIADQPDNEYEAIARNIGHLAGFVPGLMAGPLKALGLTTMARGVGALKSVPMLGADFVTKGAKKIIKPALKASRGGRFSAINTASDFMLADKAKHIAEGAFHLGVASSISSVWDGVDQMMHSFVGGAAAGGVFRGIGNIFPGTKAGDKALRAISGSMFMGLGSTYRGATTPEQIYEYLAGAYFGGKEQPWFRARAMKYLKKGDEFAKQQTDEAVKFNVERDPEMIKGFNKESEVVQKEVKKLYEEGNIHIGGDWRGFGKPHELRGARHLLMEIQGITKLIPKDKLDSDGYRALNMVIKGQTSEAKTKAHKDIHIATSGGAKGADASWNRVLAKYDVPVVNYLTKGMGKKYDSRKLGENSIRRDLSEKDLYSLGHIVDKANRTLQRPISDKNLKIFLRNAHQIKEANSVFAIGEIVTNESGKKAHLNGRTVDGGTGWGVQMALDKGLQKVFVYDTAQRSWFKWNRDANAFTPITEAPKLTRNPALIGTRGDVEYRDSSGKKQQYLSDHAKQAIKDVAEKTFGDKPLTQSKVKGAIPEKELKEYNPKTVKNLQRLNDLISGLKDSIKLTKKSISQKPDAKRLKVLKAELKEEKKLLKGWQQELKVHTKLTTTQWKDIDSGKIYNDIDTGMTASDYPLMKKGESFATNYLKDLWKGSETKRDDILNYGLTVEKAIRDNVERGNKNVKVAETVKEIEDALNTKLSEDATRQIKRWMTELNLGKQVTYLQVGDLGKTPLIRLTKDSRPVSLSGKSLSQMESPKLIEQVYFEELKSSKIKLKKDEKPLVIFDSVTKYNDKGMLNDIPLDKLENFFKYQMNSKNPEFDANAVKKKVMSKMAKDGYYPLGGQSDKGS